MNLKNFNHETFFVLLCACSEPDKKRCDRIINAAGKINDWTLVYEIAQNQRVLPFLYINIKNILHAQIPGKIFEKFKTAYLDVSARNLYLSSFLLRLIGLFNHNSVNVLPLKGPVIAQDLYGDINLRGFSDLDILVDTVDAVKAWSILLENKFQPELTLDIKQFKKFIKHEDNISFLDPTGKISVELHWELSGFYLSKPLSLRHVEKNLTRIPILNKKIPHLSSENLLIYLCIHGAKHGWEFLEQICCVAELIKNKEINWRIVNETALNWQSKRMLGIGLYLSWKVLDAPVPDSVVFEIKKDKKIPVLSQEVVVLLFENPLDNYHKSITNRFSSFHIRIRDNFSDKLKYFFRLIFSPTYKEWINFPLPAWLSFLHYFLRPYRLMMSKLRSRHA